MKKILILFGGNSSEHYISCKSAKSILENINRKLFDVTSVGLNLNNEWFIYDDELKYLETEDWIDKNVTKIENIIEFLKQFDVVFPVIHGNTGEDGKIIGMLELFNIKYVGCNLISNAIGFDKGFSKYIFNELEIPQVKYLIIQNDINIKFIEKNLSYPVIVKPANGGSSIGISKANNKKLIISDPGEIISGNEWYDYNAKYKNKNSKTIIPNIPKNIKNLLKEYAKKAFIGINAKGLARIDFFYKVDTNEIFINEINTLPGFTTISMYPILIEHKNISYKDLITKLINNAYY